MSNTHKDIFVLFDKAEDYYATIYQEQTQVFLDSRLNIIKQFNLDDLSSNMKLKYRKSFNFKFDTENEEEDNGNMQFSY